MLRKLIAQTVEKRDITLKYISDQTGVSHSSLSKFVNGHSEIAFPSVVKIVRMLFPELEKKLMKDYIDTQRKPENIRMAMEYASLQNMTDLLEKVVATQLNAKNPLNREWARVYQVDYKWQSGQINIYELLEISRELRVKEPEMKFLRLYYEFFSYYYSSQFGFLHYIADRMKKKMADINPESFFFDSLSVRLHRSLANMFFIYDELDKARFHAQKVIDLEISLEHTARMYHLIGLSYLYEEGDNALNFLYKSKKLFERIGNSEEYINIDRSIIFVASYHRKTVEIDETRKSGPYLQEVAHQEISRGNLQEAKRILQEIDEDALDPKSKAFQYYYLGLCENDISYFYRSAMLFNQCGFRFYGKLPCIELLKRGEKEAAVSAAYGREFSYREKYRNISR